MYFLLDLQEKQKVPESCSVAEGRNATKKTITISFLSKAGACAGKGVHTDSSSVQILKSRRMFLLKWQELPGSRARFHDQILTSS